MAKLTIHAKDMAKGLTVPEGWYKGKLMLFETKANKARDGINYIPTVEYSDKSGVERNIQTWFSDKSLGLDFARFQAAVLDKKLDVSIDIDVHTEEIEKKAKEKTELWVHIVQDTYNGRLINKMDNYLTASEEIPF